MSRVDNFSSLGDDDSSLGYETPCCGPCGLHEFLPCVWVQETRGVGGADGFSWTATGEEFQDRGLECSIGICEFGGFRHLLVNSAKAIAGLRPSFSAHVSGFPARAPPTSRCAAFIKESRIKFACQEIRSTLVRTWGTRPISSKFQCCPIAPIPAGATPVTRHHLRASAGLLRCSRCSRSSVASRWWRRKSQRLSGGG
jgi:hypothetical protein